MKPQIQKLLEDRYFLSSEKTWEEVAERVSNLYPPLLDAIKNMFFIPSTPTLLNANTKGERIGTLSSCFIVKIEDSMEAIMDTMKDVAIITKKSGGTGINFSNLRSSKEVVKSNGKNSGGVLPFIGIFDAILDGVRQGGSRRGAGMSMLNINHPDILDFIDAKKDKTKFTRSNFSVGMSDNFYKSLEKTPEKVVLVKEVITGKETELKDEKGLPITYKQLWNKIIHYAWNSGEPGLFNVDTARNQCTCIHISKDVFSNPCGEFVNIPMSSCSLGSINVSKLVKGDKTFDFTKFDELVSEATMFMNSVIDNNDFPIEKIARETLNGRPIGIGLMGVAHVFFKMGISYDSIEAVKLMEYINHRLTMVSMRKSIDLAKEKGPYKYFNYEVFMKANKRFFEYEKFDYLDVDKLKEDLKKYGCYNSSQTSIAPTGSISTIADTSGGIEPVFSLAFTRKVEKLNKQYDLMYIVDPVFESYVEDNFKTNKEKIYQYITENKGSCKGCNLIPEEAQKIFVTAGDLNVEAHLNILEASSKYTSLSVSKTVNLPNEAKEEDVANVYLDAYRRGIIGVTVYRDGCREGILLNKPTEKKVISRDVKLPSVFSNGPTHVIKKEGKKFYIHFSYLPEDKNKEFPICLWIYTNHKYHPDELKVCNRAARKLQKLAEESNIDNKFIKETVEKARLDYPHSRLGRMISLNLRHRVPRESILTALMDVDGDNVSTLLTAVRKFLSRTLEDGVELEGKKCPQCKAPVRMAEGCMKCSQNCGWSAC
jgi:ribonucleoside-diphosphate reductase alpha chain